MEIRPYDSRRRQIYRLRCGASVDGRITEVSSSLACLLLPWPSVQPRLAHSGYQESSGDQERTGTSTPVRALDPYFSASADFATWAHRAARRGSRILPPCRRLADAARP